VVPEAIPPDVISSYPNGLSTVAVATAPLWISALPPSLTTVPLQ
jgi:hypothetical protein